MKKYFILGFFAAVFAVGSSFILQASEQAYIWAKTSASQTNFTCQRCENVTCNNIGTVACKVQISTTINGGTKTVNGRRFNGGQCTPVLTDNTSL